MLRILKQLFCKHEYEVIYSIHIPELAWFATGPTCTKCNKNIERFNTKFFVCENNQQVSDDYKIL